MRKIYLDFETYWSQDHSLTKIHPVEYVMHPETEIQSVAIKEGDDGETFVLFGEKDIQAWVDHTDFSDAMLIGHNMAGFDAMICAWRFGIKPKAWSCTLAIARALGYAKTVGGSLKKVAAALELGAKLDLEATNTKGKKLADFTPEEIESMRTYNVVDTELCAGIFNKLAPQLGIRELRLIDMTIRMLVEPQFELDEELLERTLAEIKQTQRDVLIKVAHSLLPELSGAMEGLVETDTYKQLLPEELIEQAKKVLASAPKFAKFLESKGVPVPMKPSPSNPEKQIPALAKTDEDFLALQEHEDFEVAAAASARLGVKSTILETRIEQFLRCGRAIGGRMPIALNYYGADTTGRWSGTMKMNQQNLPRVNPHKPKPSDALRKCLLAPRRKSVVVADLSGIELRVNHFLWKEVASMQLFNDDPAKADLYKDFASKLYKKDWDEVTKAERQVGKVAHLGLGYGAGAATFQKVAKIMGGVDLSLKESEEVVAKWRNEYGRIAAGWRTCHDRLSDIYYGHYGINIDPWGLCQTIEGGIKTPLGMIRYPDLRQETNEETGRTEWVYGHGRKKARIYAGKVTENIVQHLAREAMADMMLEIQKCYPIAHTVHDEIILVVAEHDDEEALAYMQSIMRRGVKWWPDLVTWSEGSTALNYGEAKD